MLGIAWAAIEEHGERTRLIETVPLIENRVRAGVFYVLKWALTFCPEQSTEIFDEMMVHSAQELGAHYETLVDSLKLTKHGLAHIEVDRAARLMTVYEGGDMTGEDWALVEQQQRTSPFRAHVPAGGPAGGAWRAARDCGADAGPRCGSAAALPPPAASR